jgi:hypothetical protein
MINDAGIIKIEHSYGGEIPSVAITGAVRTVAGRDGDVVLSIPDIDGLQSALNSAGVPQNVVYTTGNQLVDGRKSFTNGLNAGSTSDTVTLYIGSGKVGINNENPTAALDVSGSVKFNQRPTVNGTGVLLSGELAQVDLSKVVAITGDQLISGSKTFAEV